jgi:predicted nucleic acid-binding protein
MKFLLDTNICTEYFRRPSGLAHRFTQYGGRLCVATVFLASSMLEHITSVILAHYSRRSPTY